MFQFAKLWIEHDADIRIVYVQFEIDNENPEFLLIRQGWLEGETLDSVVARAYEEAVARLETVLSDARDAAQRFPGR